MAETAELERYVRKFGHLLVDTNRNDGVDLRNIKPNTYLRDMSNMLVMPNVEYWTFPKYIFPIQISKWGDS